MAREAENWLVGGYRFFCAGPGPPFREFGIGNCQRMYKRHHGDDNRANTQKLANNRSGLHHAGLIVWSQFRLLRDVPAHFTNEDLLESQFNLRVSQRCNCRMGDFLPACGSIEGPKENN